MTIVIKNKETLIFDDFVFRCAIGEKGLTKKKLKETKRLPEDYFH